MKKLFAIIFFVLSIVLIGYGFITMYVYGDYMNGDVGSASFSEFGHVIETYHYDDDMKYDLIINGLRGLGFIASGIFSGIIGLSISKSCRKSV